MNYSLLSMAFAFPVGQRDPLFEKDRHFNNFVQLTKQLCSTSVQSLSGQKHLSYLI